MAKGIGELTTDAAAAQHLLGEFDPANEFFGR
jgi:hypothetical protein